MSRRREEARSPRRDEAEEGNEVVVGDELLIVSSWRHLLESEHRADYYGETLLACLRSLTSAKLRVQCQKRPQIASHVRLHNSGLLRGRGLATHVC